MFTTDGYEGLERSYNSDIPGLDPLDRVPSRHPEVPDYPPQPRPQQQPIQLPRLQLPKLSYPKLFLWAILPLSALSTLVLIATSLKPAPVSQTPTPNNPQVQNLELSQAIQITLGEPLQVEGQAMFVSDPSTKLEAATRVLSWQESELIQKRTNEVAVALTVGMATPGHICYQLPQESCLAKLNEQNDRKRLTAQAQGDSEAELAALMQSKVLDRVAAGQSQPHQYQPQLATMAQVQYRAAVAQLNQISPNGRATDILQRLNAGQQQ